MLLASELGFDGRYTVSAVLKEERRLANGAALFLVDRPKLN
jgi:hypothetical protein